MPVFTYRAADRRGQTVDGVMEAADARAVVERLHREAFDPIRVEPRAAFRDAVISALAYPLVITLVGAGAIVFLLTFVIPRFATIFSDLGQTIPLPTQILLSVSSVARTYWWVAPPLVLAIVLVWRMWTSTVEGRLAWDQGILRLPIIGPLATKIETARFTRTLGTMLKSGVPVLGAMAVVGDMMSNTAIANAVSRIGQDVKRGGTIAASMREHASFPTLAVHWVRVGE